MLPGPENIRPHLTCEGAAPEQEGFAVYYGRKFFNFLGECFSGFGNLVGKVKTLALSILGRSPENDHLSNTPPESPSLSRHAVKRLSASSSSSRSTSSESVSGSESADSDSESNSLSDSQPVVVPFSWKPEENDLLVTVMRTMCKHLAEHEVANPFDEIALNHFRELHEKLSRVWHRSLKQKENAALKAVFDEYFKLPDPKQGVLQSAFSKLMFWSNQVQGKGKEDVPETSPRVDFGGIQQVGNSCWMNALLQIIPLDRLNELPIPAKPASDSMQELKKYEQELKEYEKKKLLFQALKLMLRLKDDPNASDDEVWVAALVLRNLIYDTGFLVDCKVDNLAYFRQQDVVLCLELLLGGNQNWLIKFLQIEDQQELIPDRMFRDPFSVIQLAWDNSVKRDFQSLLIKDFGLYKGDKEQRRSFTCHQIGKNTFFWEPPKKDFPCAEAFLIRNREQFAEDETNKTYFTCLQAGENRYSLRLPPKKEIELTHITDPEELKKALETPVIVEVEAGAFSSLNIEKRRYIAYPPLNQTDHQVRFPNEICLEQNRIQVEKDGEGQPALPKFLYFSLSRWKDNKKNAEPIQFPADGMIDLSNIFDETVEGPIHYQLTGALIHHGKSLHGGHYTSYRTRDHGKTWHHYDDNFVRHVISDSDTNIPSEVRNAIENEGYTMLFEMV